jgi:hypothetical protein
MVRSRAALLGCAALLATAVPTVAQEPSTPPTPDLCVVTLDELGAIIGLTFDRMASGSSNCAYDGGPDEAPYLIDLRLEDPGNGFHQFDDPSDRMAGYQFTIRDSQETTVDDRLAWLGADGLAVDMGGQVLVVEPILVFATDAPDPLSFLPPLGEMVADRLPEDISAVPATPFPLGDS